MDPYQTHRWKTAQTVQHKLDSMNYFFKKRSMKLGRTLRDGIESKIHVYKDKVTKTLH